MGKNILSNVAKTTDGIEIYYEVTGSGEPIIFVHEYAGDLRSWEQQVRYFSRQFKCITYNARGYTPSTVPTEVEKYSQEFARDDLLAVLNDLEIETSHIVGLSMGAFATLHFGMTYPERVKSMVIAGCGYGAEPHTRELFIEEAENTAKQINQETMESFAKGYVKSPNRIQYFNKDQRGAIEFEKQLGEHSTVGSANTILGVQSRRPSLYDLETEIRKLKIPTLIINGDEDEPCLNVGIFLKKLITTSAMITLPQTGHASNLEEPSLFNMFCDNFFHKVDAGQWKERDPRSFKGGIMSRPEK